MSKKMPHALPSHYGFGDENEAVLYAYGNTAAWKATPGALDWLSAKINKRKKGNHWGLPLPKIGSR